MSSVWICALVSFVCRCILFCVFACTCLCVLGRVSKCVLAACFVCCSCCDRWSAAHAQINRPTLMKSGFCLLSNSLSLSVSHSLYVFLLCLSLYFTALSLNQGHTGIQRELCRIATVPWRDGQRETGGRRETGQAAKRGIEKKQENKQ